MQWSTCAVWALRVHLHAGVKGSRLIVAVHVVCTPLTNTAGVLLLLLLLLQFADVYAFCIMSEWLQLPRSFHTGCQCYCAFSYSSARQAASLSRNLLSN
jgi:hypothetical protein